METNPNATTWPQWQRQLFRFVFVWVGLMLATFPFPRPYLPDLGKLLLPFTTALAEAVARLLHMPTHLVEIASDTRLMYVHMALMFILALVVSGIWGWRDRRAIGYPKLQYVLLTAMRYFLAAAMLTYGFAKVFKTQFYLPDPNTLYTPLGNVHRDLLFWSTTGASHSYSVFTGAVEVLVGILLLFRGTRLAGGLLGIGVMVNVVALNLSYDISVKIYSSLLLLLCVLIVVPDFPRMWALLRGRGFAPSSLWTPAFAKPWQRQGFLALKTLVVCALLFDALGPFFESGNFNDDTARRPPYHGAYEVTTFVSNGDTLPPDLRITQRWRRVFVHRDGFLIVQTMDDKMQDYSMVVQGGDPKPNLLLLTNTALMEWTPMEFEGSNNQFTAISGVFKGDTLAVQLRALDWRALPLLQGEFNWTSDEM